MGKTPALPSRSPRSAWAGLARAGSGREKIDMKLTITRAFYGQYCQQQQHLPRGMRGESQLRGKGEPYRGGQ